ncbi:Mobile element protein [hydrothermal vent metagenome]|uniref:Mobile element protein n=1 Tax=hydrothermal vent metagenome TaxID=652676 RepID=A0A3B0YDT0_9ZZZZ
MKNFLKRILAIKISKELLTNEEFKHRHRRKKTDFTRNRALSFELVLVLVLRNSVKSLQLVVNEAMNWFNSEPVTASAYSQARYKFKHTAFIELNEKAVVEPMYASDDYQRFWGYRLLGIDGSKIRLPDTQEVNDEFGNITYSNGDTLQGKHPYALASVMYDVLNRVVLTAELAKAKAYEVDLAIAHLAHTKPQDLLIMDRNYPSYRMLAELAHHERDFVIRCSAASYKEARQMLKGQGKDSQIVTLKPHSKHKEALREKGLSQSLRVRFVRVQLSTGEYEVLITSLTNEDKYPSDQFKALYSLRWGIETFYGVLKTRLELENFTGTGVEAVKQDFFSTLYISGLESLLVEPAQDLLDQKKTKHVQKVNRAVSFNAIKDQAFALLFLSDLDNKVLLERLTLLFQKNPCLERKHRNPPRVKTPDRRLLNFHKRQKKRCF